MFETSIAGSLPKPAWLAETNKLWPQWRAEGDALRQAKADATLLWIKAQEDAGLDIVCDGEQSRQHFVHGFLEQVEGIDFDNKVKMGIDRKSTRLNSSHLVISYAVFCLKKKKLCAHDSAVLFPDMPCHTCSRRSTSMQTSPSLLCAAPLPCSSRPS